MADTNLNQFLVENPSIGQSACVLMLEREKRSKPTVIKDINDLGVPVDLIWEWTVDPDTNVIDVRRLSFALYEHCWGTPAARRCSHPADWALIGASNFIVEKLVLQQNNPVPCSTCGAQAGELCTYFGTTSQNKHDARMEAIHAFEGQLGGSAN